VSFLDMGANPAWLNVAILAGAAVVIWFAGTRLSEEADEIARRTGLGQAFVGLLLLALATSLPEVATTVTASLRGNAPLATNNLLGGVAMQTAILAVADVAVVRGALTFFTPRPVLLLQGVLLVILLTLTLAAVTSGELLSVAGVGLWSTLLFGAYLLTLDETRRYEGNERWRPRASELEQEALTKRGEESEAQTEERRERWKGISNARLYGAFAGFSLVILVTGWTVARDGEALAEQTGLGQSFVGATLVAITTSLPEVSTTLSAARLGNYSMAFSNIFGSNALMVGLFFCADVFYWRGLVVDAVDRASQFAAALGIVVTCVYLWGLLERRDKTVFGMGVDSALVLIFYLGGLAVLYRISRG
jgi:cation:H+ antiporter